MRPYGRWLGRGLLFLAPLCLGTAGLVSGGLSLLDALFQSLCMYTLSYQEPPPNLLVELARWTAPLAAAGGVFLAVGKLREGLRRGLRGLREDSVAVYGPESIRREVLERLPGQGLLGIDAGEGWDWVRGGSYLLLGGEEENFAFYSRNREALDGHIVYLRSSSLPAQSADSPELRPFSPEETAARLFWQEHCPFETSRQQGHQMQVVLLGFGALGEQVLTYGLLSNLFDPGQRIEYHLFGGGEAFTALHPGLSATEDPVFVHTEPWYEALPLLEEAQMVVVLTQEGQLALLRDLLLTTTQTVFHVFDREESGGEFLSGQERLRHFHWEGRAWDPANIFSDAMFRLAKEINLRFAQRYQGAGDSPRAREEAWARLDSFTRYSNVSAADYHRVRLLMLEALGWPRAWEELTPEQREQLAELEHMRWFRYHALHNWRFGVPEDGRQKDPVRRIHTDLIPYRDLSEADKEKDRDNIRLLLSLGGGGP